MHSAVRSRPPAPAVSLPTAVGTIALLGMVCRASAQQAQPVVEVAPSSVVALVGSLAQRLPGLWGSLPGVTVTLGAVLMLQRMLASSVKPKAHKLPPIPEEEVDRRCAAWVPAPPVPHSTEEYRQPAVVEGYEGFYALLHGGPVPKALHLAHTPHQLPQPVGRPRAPGPVPGDRGRVRRGPGRRTWLLRHHAAAPVLFSGK